MKIETCKTMDLSDNDWQQIANGFSRSFDRKKEKGELFKYYQKNEFGYSYHAVARDENDKIYGYTSVVPFYYTVDGEIVKIGLSGGSFVLEEYRSDIFIFKKMYDQLKKRCSTDNLIGIAGVPNSNSYQYTIKILKKKHLRNLNYYVLPVAPFYLPGKSLFFKKVLYLLAKQFAIVNVWVSNLVNFKADIKRVQLKESESFFKNRLDDKYKMYHQNGIAGSYRMYMEDGKQVAYIMHFEENGEKTYRALSNLVRIILKDENPDLIFYVGTLHLRQLILFKVPERVEPKQLPLTITLLDSCTNEMEEKLMSPENWDFSLINFDVR